MRGPRSGARARSRLDFGDLFVLLQARLVKALMLVVLHVIHRGVPLGLLVAVALVLFALAPPRAPFVSSDRARAPGLVVMRVSGRVQLFLAHLGCARIETSW